MPDLAPPCKQAGTIQTQGPGFNCTFSEARNAVIRTSSEDLKLVETGRGKRVRFVHSCLICTDFVFPNNMPSAVNIMRTNVMSFRL